MDLGVLASGPGLVRTSEGSGGGGNKEETHLFFPDLSRDPLLAPFPLFLLLSFSLL